MRRDRAQVDRCARARNVAASVENCMTTSLQQLVLIGLEVKDLRPRFVHGEIRLDKLYDRVSSVSKATRDLSHDLHPFALRYVGPCEGPCAVCVDRLAKLLPIHYKFCGSKMCHLWRQDVSLCFISELHRRRYKM